MFKSRRGRFRGGYGLGVGRVLGFLNFVFVGFFVIFKEVFFVIKVLL